MVHVWYYKGTHKSDCVGNVAGFYNKKDSDGEIILNQYTCSVCGNSFEWSNED